MVYYLLFGLVIISRWSIEWTFTFIISHILIRLSVTTVGLPKRTARTYVKAPDRWSWTVSTTINPTPSFLSFSDISQYYKMPRLRCALVV